MLDDELQPQRLRYVLDRLARNQQHVLRLNTMYHHACQICQFTIPTPIGNYLEAAHIKPLGKPHNGVDSISTMICLCPNHHKMLDFHTFTIADDLSLIGSPGTLHVVEQHDLNKQWLAYHRKITFGMG